MLSVIHKMRNVCFREVKKSTVAIFGVMVACIGCQSIECGQLQAFIGLIGQSDRDVELGWRCADLGQSDWSEYIAGIDRVVRIEPISVDNQFFSQELVFFQSNRVVCVEAIFSNCSAQISEKWRSCMRRIGSCRSSDGKSKYGAFHEVFTVNLKRESVVLTATYFQSESNISFRVYAPNKVKP
jgi:hypothetical protein